MHEVTNALIEYDNWLSDKFMLVPRKAMIDAYEMANTPFWLYMYICDEFYGGRVLMDDDGYSYIILVSDDMAELFHVTSTSIKLAMKKLRDKKLIETVKHQEFIGGVWAYLLDDKGKRMYYYM